MGFDPLLPLTAIQPKTNCLKEDNNNNSTISIGMQLLNSGQLSDVILICEGIEIPAHRLILSCTNYSTVITLSASVFCFRLLNNIMNTIQVEALFSVQCLSGRR